MTAGALAAAAISPAFAGSAECSKANVDAYLDTSLPARKTRIDKAKFYEKISTTYSVFEKRGQHYDGTDAIIDQWNSDRRLKDNRWLAYVLATAYHETAHRMYPVREHLAESDDEAVAIFKKNARYANTSYWHKNHTTGERYYGRGYVQLTWDYNYQRADKWFGIDQKKKKNSFYWNADNALTPSKSVDITFEGMIYGWFTSQCLLRYFPYNERAQWRDARRIINGLDRADDIAVIAQNFLIAIDAAEVSGARTAALTQTLPEGSSLKNDAPLAKSEAKSDGGAQPIALAAATPEKTGARRINFTKVEESALADADIVANDQPAMTLNAYAPGMTDSRENKREATGRALHLAKLEAPDVLGAIRLLFGFVLAVATFCYNNLTVLGGEIVAFLEKAVAMAREMTPPANS